MLFQNTLAQYLTSLFKESYLFDVMDFFISNRKEHKVANIIYILKEGFKQKKIKNWIPNHSKPDIPPVLFFVPPPILRSSASSASSF